MSVNLSAYQAIKEELSPQKVILVAVSKTKPIEDIQTLYDAGQLDFGENYVQELVEKQSKLPANIRWHFIGHLQSNKVKIIAPFVHLIHGVDSLKLLKEINKEAQKNNRVIDVLLQVFIADEETKFGLNAEELKAIMDSSAALKHIQIQGLMGMASFSTDLQKVRAEFASLKQQFNLYPQLSILSMGMSGDYAIAIEEGSTMVRIGSLLFGARG